MQVRQPRSFSILFTFAFIVNSGKARELIDCIFEIPYKQTVLISVIYLIINNVDGFDRSYLTS